MAANRTELVGEIRAFGDSFARDLKIATAVRSPNPARNNMMAVVILWHLKMSYVSYWVLSTRTIYPNLSIDLGSGSQD